MRKNSFLIRLKAGSFYKKLLISYIVLLLIVAFVISIVTTKLINTISDYTVESGRYSVSQYQVHLENKLRAIESLPTDLLFDDRVKALLSHKGDFDPLIRYGFTEIISKLNSYKFLNGYIKSIFIYLPEQQYIITGNSVYTVEQWSYQYLRSDSFFNILNSYNYNNWYTLEGDGEYAKTTAMICSLPLGEHSGTKGALCIIIDPAKISFDSSISADTSDCQMFTFNPNGNIMFSTQDKDTLLKNYPVNISELTPGVHKKEGYAFCVAHSSEFDLTHVVMLPLTDYEQTLTASTTIAITWIVLLLLTCLIVSLALARYNYSPIQRIAKLMDTERHGVQENVSSLEYIEASINQLLAERKQTRADMAVNKQQYMDALLTKLIHNEILNESLIHEYMEKFGLEIKGEYVQIIYIQCDEPSLLRQSKLLLEQALVSDMNMEFDFYLLDGMNNFKLFLFLKSKYSGSKIYGTLEHLFAEQLDNIIVSMGEIYNGLPLLNLSYEEAKKVADYMTFLGLHGIMRYSELNQADHFNENSLVFETWFRKFANLIIDQNLSAAQSIQGQIFEELTSKQYTLQFVKCKIFSFIDHTISVIGGMDASYVNNIWEDFSLADRLLNCITIEELEKEYHAIFSFLSNILLSSASKMDVIEHIRKITSDNYLNPDFNVSFVSDQLNVSHSYVSKIFKKETGKNLLDHVHQLRIAYAKQLMADKPNLTLADIACQSGFYNDVTLIRVFKKYEGITPGKYRSQLERLSKT